MAEMIGAGFVVVKKERSVAIPQEGGSGGPPSPLPVREGSVYLVPNHEVTGCPEAQICHPKGVIAKYVQTLELGSAIRAGAPPAFVDALTVNLCETGSTRIPSKVKRPPQWWLFCLLH